mgnify:CR=1 FL=1
MNRGIIAWFIANPIAANFLMALLIISGVVSVFNIAKQYEPEKQQDKILVSAVYPGAVPQEVEESIVVKIEERNKFIEGIEKFESTSQFSAGSVLFHLADGDDMARVLREIRSEVNAISTFPVGMESLVVQEVKNWRRLMFVQLYGEAEPQTIKEITKDIRDDIAQLEGVSKAHIPWIEKYEIAIEVSPEKILQYQLSLDEIASKIRLISQNIGGGVLRSQSGDIKVYSNNKARHVHEFENLVIVQRAGRSIKLKDIATVTDTFEEKGSFFGFNGHGGEAIAIDSIGNQNDLAVSERVYAYLEQKRATLPDGIKLEVWSDNSYYLAGRLMLLVENILVGSVLIFIFIGLFLNLQLAFWVVLGVFTTISGVVALMPLDALGSISINMFSLFAFILVLGIVVDDAVIIGEGAYQECEHAGNANAETIYKGVKKVSTPAIFGVLTTILAFVPLVILQSESSSLWNTIGIVAILCLLVSLVESKLILPSHLVGMRLQRKQDSKLSRQLQQLATHHYPRFLSSCLDNRGMVLLLFSAVFFSLYAYYKSGHIKTVLWPKLPSDYINVVIKGNEGLPNRDAHLIVQDAIAALDEVEQSLFDAHGVEVVKHHLYWRQGDSDSGIFVELIKAEDRPVSTDDIIVLWREKIGMPAGVKSISIDQASSSAGPNFALSITSQSPSQLLNAAADIKQYLINTKGVMEAFDSSHGGTEQLKLAILPQGEFLGLTVSDIALQVRQSVYGIEVHRLIKGSEDTKVMLRYPKALRIEASDIDDVLIKTPAGHFVPLQQVATYHYESAVSQIQRVNGVNAIHVSAYVNDALVSPEQVQQAVMTFFDTQIKTQYPQVAVKLSGNALEAQKTMLQMYGLFFVVTVLIYGALAIPLRSYFKPLIILLVIPLSFFGALVGHIVLDINVSLLSFMGCMALSGVVVNDSLVLMHQIYQTPNPTRAEIIRACASRFRPIFINSFTTFLGLVPLLIESNPQSQFIVPMAVSLSFGVLLSSMITLVLIPLLVSMKFNFKFNLYRTA